MKAKKTICLNSLILNKKIKMIEIVLLRIDLLKFSNNYKYNKIR